MPGSRSICGCRVCATWSPRGSGLGNGNRRDGFGRQGREGDVRASIDLTACFHLGLDWSSDGDCSRRGSSRLAEAYERFDNSAIQADDLRG